MYDNSAGVSIGKAVRPIAIEDREAQERTNVGPGAYDPKDQNKMLGLGAVVPLATRFIIDEKNTKEACEKPGPGTYDVPAIGINTSKGVSIPIVGHSMMYPLSVSPGPGEYDTGSTLDPNKGPTIGGEAQRSSAFIDGPGKDAPGPGAYDPSLSAVEPNPRAHTILGKSVSTDVGNINVGPGSYDPQEMLRNYTQSFSHAPRIFDQITGSEVPGPGWYAVNHRPIDPKSYETFIGNKPALIKAEEKKQNDGPGPGYYDSTSPGDKDVRTFSMGTSAAQRPEIIGQPNRDAVNIPGPGQYDLALEWIRDAKFTIHALDRFISHQKVSLDAPGPGYYAIPSFIGQNTSKAPTIGTKSTKESGFLGVDKVGAETSTPSPGPGTYDPYNTMRKLADAPGPSFSFSLAKKYGLDSKTHLYPGPGAYNVTLPKLNGNGVSFSVAGRKDPNVSGGLGPGPGAYNIDTAKDLIMENQPSFTFPGKSYLPEGREKNEVPGPGAYDSAAAEEYLKTSPGYSFGKAQAPVSHYSLTSNAPGPGSYDTHLKNDSPAFSFGRDKKSDEKENHGKNCSPGPGEYNTMLSPEGPFYSISGKFQDPTERHETCVPGPGAYNIADMSGPYVNENVHAHYFTKSERFPTVKEDEQIPGPGAYLSHITKDGALIQGVRSVSFPSAARIPRDLKEDTPGPGMYDTNVQLLGPFWSITGKPLEAHSGMNRVGPGEYNLSNTPWIDPSKGVGFMRANRFPESESDAPGPGQYDVSLQWIDPRKGHLFTTSDRTDEVQSREAKSMPGPGEYHLVNVQNGPYWTIKGKPAEMNPSNDVPGPGAYNLTSRLDLPSAPSATIALAEPPRERELQQAASAPGPGTYRIPGTLSPLGTIIGKEVRYTNGLDPIPGPGTYDTTGRHLFGDHAAKYSFPKAERNTIDQHTMDTPGPGMYDGHLGKDTILPKDPVHTIPQTDRGYIPVSATGSYGGPGAYNLGAPPYGGPVWSVPSGPRTKIGSDNGVPGVGVYNIPNRWSGNGPTISGKWKDKAVEGSPGPGEYRVQDYDPYRRDMATIIDFSKGSERVINTNIGTGSGPVYYSPSYYNPPL